MSKWNSEKEARGEILRLVGDYYRQFKDGEPGAGDRIPYGGRVYDEVEMQRLVGSALDLWLTAGREADAFEREFAEWMGAGYAHLVNSGSSANLLALAVLTAPELGERRIRPGDEVITAACAFPTTVAPILQYGAVPVFVDVTLPGCNVDVARLEEAVSSRTRAVMLAHTLGNPFDLAAVRSFCDEHDLWLIEDNCDALGSSCTLNGTPRLTGTVGHIGTVSFYPPHHMTMGEGGCVITDDPLLSRLILSYRDWGRDCVCPPGTDGICGHRFDGQHGSLPEGYDHKYVYSHLGYNLKITDMQAAVGRAQLQKLPSFIDARKKNWARLREGLDPLSDRLILPEPTPGSDPSWFGFLISVRPESGLVRDEITTALEARGIQTRLLFGGNLLRHPCFEALDEGAFRVAGSLENTDFVMNNTFWIGVYPGLTGEMIDRMIREITSIVEEDSDR